MEIKYDIDKEKSEKCGREFSIKASEQGRSVF